MQLPLNNREFVYKGQTIEELQIKMFMGIPWQSSG